MASSSQVETASAIRTETVSGSHMFKVFGYSLTKGIGIGRCILSEVFTIGGYDWVIEYYPDGDSNESAGFISFFLRLLSVAAEVKVQYTFTMLRRNGVLSNMSVTSNLTIFRHTSSIVSAVWGYPQFIQRTDFEASKYLRDDTFTIKCTLTVMKGTTLEAINPYGIVVPPSNLNQNLANLLESGQGADVTFLVKRERFDAHRCVLAARSPVFSAELFGCMKEKWTDTIVVKDIEAPVFKSMLYFIYSDSVPDFEGTSDEADGQKQDVKSMAQHLLVAADRYQLERLRLMCEDLLCKNLSVNNAAETLVLAERHNCSQLKAQCLSFMRSPEAFKEVALTSGFRKLMEICPSILKDIKALNFN